MSKCKINNKVACKHSKLKAIMNPASFDGLCNGCAPQMQAQKEGVVVSQKQYRNSDKGKKVVSKLKARYSFWSKSGSRG